MIYGYEQIAPLPILDLYDTNVMMKAIDVARDLYDRGERRMKEFEDKYGDFYSPIQSDMDWYNNEMGKINQQINNLYAQGIDPIRSAEGRAAVQQIIRGFDKAGLNQRRRSALAAEQYIKSRDAAIANGVWNPEYERQMLGGKLLEEWTGKDDRGNYVPWTATSVSPYQDYERKYGHLFDKMGEEYDEEASKAHPGFLVMNKSKARMRDILSSSRPDLVNDPQYQYDLGRIQNVVMQNNPEISPEEAKARATSLLENEIIERNHKGGMRLIEDPDYQRIQDFKFKNAIDANNTARDINKEKILRANTPGFDAKGNAIPGYSKTLDTYDIFHEAAMNAGDNKAGQYVQYEDTEQYYQHIDPIVQPKNVAYTKNSTTGRVTQEFDFDAKDVRKPGTFYKILSDGTVKAMMIPDAEQDYTFSSLGLMRCEYKNGKYEYFVGGNLRDPQGRIVGTSEDESGNFVKNNPEDDLIRWIPVKRRLGNYGQTQKKS